MAYTIYKADGTPVTIPDNAIYPNYNGPGVDPSKRIGIQLIGRNAVDYGAPVAQSLLQMTENFSSTIAPADTTSLVGQLWFNKNNNDLYVKYASVSGAGIGNWKRLLSADGSETGTVPIVNPSGPPKAGDIRVTSSPTRISIWADGDWRQIFPAIYS